MLKKSYQKRLSIERKSDRLEPESAVITSPFWVMNGIIKRTGTLGRYLSVALLFARLVALCCRGRVDVHVPGPHATGNVTTLPDATDDRWMSRPSVRLLGGRRYWQTGDMSLHLSLRKGWKGRLAAAVFCVREIAQR